mmetsp:Transcript_64872/g.159689  ORF Transcript_64872/g.159689 Transcript_64872/m.159689 type:complete len:307 (-) Transcript_64872:2436-3356(-)
MPSTPLVGKPANLTAAIIPLLSSTFAAFSGGLYFLSARAGLLCLELRVQERFRLSPVLSIHVLEGSESRVHLAVEHVDLVGERSGQADSEAANDVAILEVLHVERDLVHHHPDQTAHDEGIQGRVDYCKVACQNSKHLDFLNVQVSHILEGGQNVSKDVLVYVNEASLAVVQVRQRKVWRLEARLTRTRRCLHAPGEVIDESPVGEVERCPDGANGDFEGHVLSCVEVSHFSGRQVVVVLPMLRVHRFEYALDGGTGGSHICCLVLERSNVLRPQQEGAGNAGSSEQARKLHPLQVFLGNVRHEIE